jgi:hypothetical protein
MADYYSLLSRAIANLPQSSPAAARRAIYDRARKALVAQLRSLKPQLPESDIAREERALEAAVARLESEFGSPQGAPGATGKPEAPPPVSSQARPSPAPPAAETAKPAPPPTPGPVRPVAPPRPPIPPLTPSRRPAENAGAAPVVARADSGRSGASAGRPPGDFAADAQNARPGFIRKTTVEPAGAPLVSPNAAEAAGPDHAPRIGSPLEPAAAGPASARAEIEPPRPSAPSANEPRRPNPWPWIALAVAVGLVASIAVAAFLWREKPRDLAIKEPAEATAPAPNGPKIAERVDGAPAPATTQTPEPETATNSAPAAPIAAPTPLSTPIQEPAPAKSSAATGATQAAPAPARAAMLVATSGDPQKPAVNLGSVVWSAAPANPGQPGSSGVKAEVEIPDLKMHATMILRKNVDASLPASHTIDLRVTFDEGSPVKGIKDIGLPQMRRDDPPSTTPLAGVRVKINDSYFLIGLNRADADIARNVDAIGSLGWFDFPMLLSDDRIAKLTFEKGADGEKIVNDAVAAWK